VSDYRTEERRPHVIAGTGDEVRDALDALSERTASRSSSSTSPWPTFAARHRVELLARAREPALA
jgi:hypothetical protein